MSMAPFLHFRAIDYVHISFLELEFQNILIFVFSLKESVIEK
ncbi:12563_t:CDS:2 [Dentiscutata erythropus]|uniref:12563_t:CDS:1 n=1 Tax=Dentiscutata erythropus TaxID=1348616 RepID=A0A9N8YY22_9GLOM|nr:12563_t:CDS:2 [Dentiscutata erythropus]